MPWIQIFIDTQKDYAETIEDLFLETGAVSVTLADAEDTPVFEPELGTTPIWANTRISALYTADSDTDAILQQLQQGTINLADSPLTFKAEILEDKDWEREWMDNFHPIQCGTRLWICPSWREPPEQSAVNLLLDPGLAFGTGTHPTTFLCLKWLDGQNLTDKNIIDYGCGSGILAIAAILLGAKKALGTDIDPQAILASRDNAQRNGVADDRFELYLPKDVPADRPPCDLLLANILAQPLLKLAPEIAAMTQSGSLLALSGIINHQAQEIIERYAEWFDLNPPEYKDEWTLITGVRK
jgi:ribosomal protein L11 methyltransferase